MRNKIASDATIRAVKPGDPRGQLTDGDGLYLKLFVNGGAHGWRFDYKLGTRKTLSLGTFPDVGLAAAREKANQYRSMVAAGDDPGQARKDAAAAVKKQAEAKLLAKKTGALPGSFKFVALDWLEHQSARWDESTKRNIKSSLDSGPIITLGDKLMGEIRALDIVEAVKKVEARGATDQAVRVLQRVKSIFRFAVVHHGVKGNPAADLRPAEILKPRRVVHRASMPQAEVPRFLGLLREYGGDPVTSTALLFLLLTAGRPGEVRGAFWAEISGSTWRIPAERMKMGIEHVVPLSRQALAVLEDMRTISSNDRLVFPSPFYPGKSLSENTLNSALARMGYKGMATAHGFRSLFSTVANENGWDPDVVERALAHEPPNEVRAAYHRALYIDERKKLMQWWADWIDAQRPTA